MPARRPGPGPGLRLVLFLGAVVVLALGATGVMAGPGARPATAAGAPPISVAAVPCAAGSGGCTTAPTALAVTFGSGTPASVEVSWATAGRPAGAPLPAQPSVVLPTDQARCTTTSGSSTTCEWAWPAGLRAGGAGPDLNGTYAVCSASTDASACPPSSRSVALAVPPSVPTGFGASVQGSGSTATVALTWSPGPEADLDGYTLYRNGTAISRCTLHGAVVSGAGACPAPLRVTDTSPGAGTASYALIADRFGAGGDTGDEVVSAPAVVTAPLGVAGGIGALPAVPYAGPVPTVPAPALPGGSSPTGPAGAGPGSASTAEPGYGNLPYGPRGAGAVAALNAEAGGGHRSVSHLALIAGGLLLLAVAAHLFYLRDAVKRFQAASGPGAPPAPAAGGQREALGATLLRWATWRPGSGP